MSILKYDIIVIGGGPSGMMAAGRAAELGASVILIEKNPDLGKKLLMTGGGRCNITNVKHNLRELINAYGKNGSFLYPAFNKFSPQEVIRFFENRGLQLKEEKGRVFPINNSALEVRQILIDYLRQNKVTVSTHTIVTGIAIKDNKVSKVQTSNGDIIGNEIIICTGGLSYPETGSTGEGHNWAKRIGHKVEKQRPSLTPIIVKDAWISDLQGVSFKEVGLTINKKVKDTGELIFTHEGISGPLVHNLSRKINSEKIINLTIDFLPLKPVDNLDRELQAIFHEDSKKAIKNVITQLLPSKIALKILELANINKEKKTAEISKKERKDIIDLIKFFPLSFRKLAGFEKAIVTAGGVSLKEIDPKTMKSKIIDNLYFAGEIIDLDGPSGGYNLQIAWSTGRLAGESAVFI